MSVLSVPGGTLVGGVELAADQCDQRDQVHPDQKRDAGADGAVHHVVAGEMADVPGESQGGEEPQPSRPRRLGFFTATTLSTLNDFPLSQISIWIASGNSLMFKLTLVAPEWRATFVSASCATRNSAVCLALPSASTLPKAVIRILIFFRAATPLQYALSAGSRPRSSDRKSTRLNS